MRGGGGGELSSEKSLSPSRPTLAQLKKDAAELRAVVGKASQLAESVSCKVRLLDQAKVSSAPCTFSVSSW